MARSKESEYSEYIRENHPLSNKGIHSRCLNFGVGINDADYSIKPKIDKVQISCPAFAAWEGLIRRAYSKEFHKKQPTYSDVTVCPEWLRFSNFRGWFIKNHVDSWKLDKDLLSIGNRVYSPETCIYVPNWLNCFITNRQASKGNYMAGVYLHSRGKLFVSQCRHPKSKNRIFLGYFENELDAHNAWLNKKLEIALELKPEMDAIDLRIYPNVVEIIKSTI